ncbi:hypothetical protein NP603_06840 [Methylomonas sp. SURF-1]|uniref:Uncharacterized protein n=1 Tax=Methylomonas aurea TaxID=2952224 RepID=A0ABT1UF14_9GAMM|nr:hypothetical protein [Methylomonas sp. SURF-1]MCQ8180817.1 hypothetical protein [Methylomonas sp. SURF-1]
MSNHPCRQSPNRKNHRLALSLDDFLASQAEAALSDYLSLSLSSEGEFTKISVTTIDPEPVTYSVLIPAEAAPDWRSVVFVAQPHKLGELSDFSSMAEKRKACVRIARLAPFRSALRSKGGQRRRRGGSSADGA